MGRNLGRHGRAFFTWDDMRTLLNASGNCTIFAPSVRAPPQPPPPDPEAEFIAAAKSWLSFRHTSRVNVAFENDLKQYLETL